MNRIRYTPEDDAEVLRLRTKGFSTQRIGQRMGRSRSSIEGRLRALGFDAEHFRERASDTRTNADQRASDDRFVKALAKAFMRGDHLPAAQRLAA